MKMKCMLLLFVLIASLVLASVGVKVKDSDKDHIPNPIDEDIDGDTVPNIVEMQHGTNPYNPFSYLIEDYVLGR